jgi:hypothetical protein
MKTLLSVSRRMVRVVARMGRSYREAARIERKRAESGRGHSQ